MPLSSRLLRPLAEWIVARRAWVVLVVLGITAFLGTRIGTLQLDTNPDSWAPQKHAYVETTKLLKQIFGGTNVVIIGITPKQGDIYQPDVLAKIQRIQQGIEQIPHAVRHNVVSLAARKVKQIKGAPDGMEARPMLEAVPRIAADIEKLKAAVSAMPIYINALVSPDGKSASIVADFKQDATIPNFVAMLQQMRTVAERERDATVDIYYGGSPVIGEAADLQFMKMPIFFGSALLVIMLIQFWSFRSIQGMILPVVTGISSVIWSLGLMALLGVHMDPLNSTTPILILAVAAGHAIQILKRYYEEYARLLSAGSAPRDANREAVVESMVRVGPVMITAGLIAAITLFSLAGTGIPMVQHFGVFAGCGVLATMVLELTIIPALRAMLRAPRKQEAANERKAGVLDRWLLAVADTLVGGRAPRLVIGGIAVLAIVAAGTAFLRVDNNFRLYHKPQSVLRVHDRVLNQTFGGTNTIQFLIQTPAPDSLKDPKVLQGISDLQAFLERQPHVGKTQSIADLVKRMNQAMHGDDPQYHTIPESRDLIAQYLFLYSLSGDPQDFDSFVDNDYRRAAVWTYFKDDSTTYADSVAKKAQAVVAQNFPPGVTVSMGGTLPDAVALNEVIVNDKFRNMAQMALVVFVLGAVAFRSLAGGLFVVTPLVAVALTNFGVMGWLDTPLDISAMISAALAIGIGADYEIYLLYRFREELARGADVLAATRQSLLTSGKAVLFVALSIIGGYAVLQFSDFAFFNQISNMVMATMVVSALFALFFLRALMMIFKPRFIFGAARDAQVGQPVSVAQGGAK